MLNTYFSHNKFVPRNNATNISLVPKVQSPTHVNQFRPISCANVIYKCITKVLANRLKEVIKDFVSPNQAAFIPGRVINDNILIIYYILYQTL